MRNYFDKQLSQLNRDLTRMGALCEEILTLTAQAMADGSPEVLKKAHSLDSEIDRMERTIETTCLKLLLQQQPVARDLRQISAALKMITDMERIGDQAEDICEIIPFLAGRSGFECQDIHQMAQAATAMVTSSVDAYVRQDIALAQNVIRQDDVVDQCFTRVKSTLIGVLRDNSADGEYALDLLMIAKYFERIGDHATNIAEWVEYSVTGVHKSEECT